MCIRDRSLESLEQKRRALYAKRDYHTGKGHDKQAKAITNEIKAVNDVIGAMRFQRRATTLTEHAQARERVGRAFAAARSALDGAFAEMADLHVGLCAAYEADAPAEAAPEG